MCCLVTQSGCIAGAAYYTNTVATTNWAEMKEDFAAPVTNKVAELLPCPYSGAKPERQGFGYYGYLDWKYLCVACGGISTTSGRDEDAVKKQWNFKVREVLHEKEVHAGETR